MSKGNDYIVPAIAVGAGVYFYNDLKKLFATDRGANNAVAQEVLTADYFSPDFWKKGGSGTLLLTVASAQEICKRLYKAKGFLWDDQDVIFAIFKTFKTKSQVSFVTMHFANMYNKDLPKYILGGNLDTEGAYELAQIKKIVDPLPNFRA
jgi:hypothetical protein